MRRFRRELAAVATVLALAACTENGAPPRGATSSAPSVSPSPTAPPSSVSPPAAPVRRYVIGVIGDYGITGPALPRVVARMRTWRPDAVVTTGDNAYCCGTADQTRYARRMLDRVGAPIFSSLGNHDVVTDDGAQFMRTFPQRQRWYTATVGPVEFVLLDSTRPGNATQLRFLRRVLSAPPTVSFRVVVFHHPGWSCSAHAPNVAVIENWLPLFGSGDVDLVLAGHNHTYERFTASDGTPYVTTGGGGAQLYASTRIACRGEGRPKYWRSVHHAVRLVATDRALRLEAITVDGAVLDRLTITP